MLSLKSSVQLVVETQQSAATWSWFANLLLDMAHVFCVCCPLVVAKNVANTDI